MNFKYTVRVRKVIKNLKLNQVFEERKINGSIVVVLKI